MLLNAKLKIFLLSSNNDSIQVLKKIEVILFLLSYRQFGVPLKKADSRIYFTDLQ